MGKISSKGQRLRLIYHERIPAVRPFIPLRYFKEGKHGYVTLSFSERFKNKVLSMSGAQAGIREAHLSLFSIEKAMNDSAVGEEYKNPIMYSLNDFFAIAKHRIKNGKFQQLMKTDHLMYVKLSDVDAVVVTICCRRNHYDFDCFELNERKKIPAGAILIGPTITTDF
jgi:hypothetical protein